MHAANKALIHKFYSAFANRDAETMAGCYADDVRFSDPVFELTGDEARGMWRMLCERGEDLRLTHKVIAADENVGSAQWEAWYTFGATGRKVHNIIDANFRFADGKIVEHHDHFDFYRWSRYALGLPGLLLGWSPMIRNKVRKTADHQLRKYMRRTAD
ncbi:MAG: nuclear transport factor 2 family protein [Myxococcota bacterium]